jgi:hypothetical protein
MIIMGACGTLEGNTVAKEDSWLKKIEFFRK